MTYSIKVSSRSSQLTALASSTLVPELEALAKDTLRLPLASLGPLLFFSAYGVDPISVGDGSVEERDDDVERAGGLGSGSDESDEPEVDVWCSEDGVRFSVAF